MEGTYTSPDFGGWWSIHPLEVHCTLHEYITFLNATSRDLLKKENKLWIAFVSDRSFMYFYWCLVIICIVHSGVRDAPTVHPGPSYSSVLVGQLDHRSQDIWYNGTCESLMCWRYDGEFKAHIKRQLLHEGMSLLIEGRVLWCYCCRIHTTWSCYDRIIGGEMVTRDKNLSSKDWWGYDYTTEYGSTVCVTSWRSTRDEDKCHCGCCIVAAIDGCFFCWASSDDECASQGGR